MKLLDTNIPIYAAGTAHRYKEACAKLISWVGQGTEDYIIDVELLQEILHVYHSRGQRAVGLQIVDHLVNLFPEPLPITRREIEAASRLMNRYASLGARDSLHAAVVLTYQLDGIVSTDRVFESIAELRSWDPAEEP
jgi:predicted nucleic acid-binding protein